LDHSDGGAEKFYRGLQSQGVHVRVGIEATGYARWFERLLAELGIELWIGDAAEIRTLRVRKQKTDRHDGTTLAEAAAGRSLSPSMDTQPGESRFAGNCFGIGIGWYRCVRAS